MAWNYIAGTICLILMGVLVGKEWIRPDRTRRMARIFASVGVVAALAGLALPLTLPRTEKKPSGKDGLFLTEGYNTDSVRTWLKEHPDTGSLGEATAWHVFGYGLTGEEWADLHAPHLIFHPSPGEGGIVAIDWQRRLTAGEPLRVQGTFRTAAAAGPRLASVKILLTGMGAVSDSIVTKSGAFSLTTTPAAIGRVVYRLIVLSGTDTLEQEPIPVEILPGKSLKILLLASSPDFENNFLLGWLAKGGHQVASRTAVSKGKYQPSFVNMPQRSLDELGPSLLGEMDLVIADAGTLSSVGPAALSALRRQITEKGLGLIVKADNTGTLNPLGSGGVEVVATKDSARLYFLKDRPGLQTLAKDSNSRIVAGRVLDGAGKIIFTTLNTTYTQALAGQRSSYAAGWTTLLKNVARPADLPEVWSWKPALPLARHPVQVILQEATATLPQGYLDGETAPPVTLYLAQDAQLPFYWTGLYWPSKAGWLSIRTTRGDTSWWYAGRPDSWKTLYRQDRQRATREYIKSREGMERDPAAHSLENPEGPEARRTPLPKGWFYLLFLLGAFFLWVERKMGRMNGGIFQ